MVVLIPEVWDIIAELFMIHHLFPGGEVLKELLRTGFKHISLIKALCIGMEEMPTPHKILSQLFGDLKGRHLIDASHLPYILFVVVVIRLPRDVTHVKTNVNHNIKAHLGFQEEMYIPLYVGLFQFLASRK